MQEPLEVVGLDSYSGHEFVLYFSDETYAMMSGVKLAECFPDRIPVVKPEEAGLEKDAGEDEVFGG